MVELVKKNISDVEIVFHKEIDRICSTKMDFFNNLFKKYDKDMIVEIIFDKSSSLYKVSASINMKSKKVLVVEEDKDVIKAVSRLCQEFKKAVKRQYELEKKEYEYKRKRKKKK